MILVKPRVHLVLFAIFAFALALLVGKSAQGQSSDVSNVKIKNFGQMDERFYRGGQPKERDYNSLKELGITTVVDLREDPKSYAKQHVEALGMRYVNIPMSDKSYPESDKIDQFLKLVDDPSTGKFFVHCAGGRHRTGVMGAVYRFNHYQWNYDQVYAEMKNFDFYTRWGHGDLKKFVKDYAVAFKSNGSASTDAGVGPPQR